MASTKTRGHRIKDKGPFIYKDFRDNHVIWPGTEPRLDEFLGQSFKGINHKRKNARSSNSEDVVVPRMATCFINEHLELLAKWRDRLPVTCRLWETSECVMQISQ